MPTRAAPAVTRFAWSAMLALMLALRLLTPPGFMPSFEHGRITVVPCDGIVAAPAPMKMAHHDGHKQGKAGHQTCPYAAGAWPALLPIVSFVETDLPLISATAVGAFAAALVLRSRQDRPPSTGPPAAA